MAIQISGARVGTLVGPTSISLNDLSDVLIANPLDGQYLRYNQGTLEWGNSFLNADVFTYLSTNMTGSGGVSITYTPGTNTIDISVASSAIAALTMDNTGLGAVSGTLFDGSVPLTISHNTIGAAPLTGVGASGTWPINISGMSSIMGQSGAVNGNWDTYFLDTPVATRRYVDAEIGGPAELPWWFCETFKSAVNSSYGLQYAHGWSHNANELYVRNVSEGAFTPWVRFLNSNNFNSFAPTLNGGNAAGTWTINTTGSSGLLAQSGVAENDWATYFLTTPIATTRYTDAAEGGPVAGGWWQVESRMSTSANWGIQYGRGWSTHSNELWSRTMNDGGFTDWVRFLNSSNFNNYAPTTTGGNASGTWNINTTGSIGTQWAITATNSIQVGVAPNGYAILGGGWNETTSGLLSFMASNGNRQGYIGDSNGMGATDTGDIKYVAGSHSFFGSMWTNNIIQPALLLAHNPGAEGALRFSCANQGSGTGAALRSIDFCAFSPTYRDVTIFNADSIGFLARQQVQYDTNVQGMQMVFTIHNALYFMLVNGIGIAPVGWQGASDSRLKENLTPITDAVAKVQKLTGYTYDRNDIETPRRAGYLAQDLQEVLPESVNTFHHKGHDAERLSTSDSGVIALLINAVKELKAEIDTLKAQLNPATN